MRLAQRWLGGFSAFLWSLPAFAALALPEFTPAGGLVRSPALVMAINPNPVGAILYMVDGSDPRDPFGNAVPGARSYSDPLSINRSIIIRARVKSGTNWSELVAAPFTADQDFSNLLFTEVMYHPRDADDVAEFIELKNVGAVSLDLSGLIFTGVVNTNEFHIDPPYFRFENGTILPAGEFLVLINNTNAFQALHPTARIDGQFTNEMPNHSMLLAIQDSSGAQATTMLYDSHAPWPVAPDNHGYFPNDGVGFSLARSNLDPAVDPESYRAWRASTYRFGSPGADDPAPIVPPIYLNEMLARTSAGLRDTIEFFNPNPTNVHIGGWWLSDERNEPFRYPIPLGTIVPAFGFLVIDDTQFGVGTNGFSLSSEGERLYLFSADTNRMLTGYTHGFGFEGSDRDVSFGRYIASDGREDFPAQLILTFDATNSGPRLSPIVISEVMYHPEGTNVEYVELRNVTGAAVPLWESPRPTSTWTLGPPYAGLNVPTNTTIPANGHLLFVQGDTNEFRTRYGVPAEVTILPLQVRLGNGGESVALYRPSGLNDNGYPRYVKVDEIVYDDRFPWPAAADGSGHSLERINLNGFGNDAGNWRACPQLVSPGRSNSTNLPPLVWAGGDQTEFINRPAMLTGAVSDDRWLGTGLTSWWSQVSGPASAIFVVNGRVSASVTFPQTGRYVVQLTASDSVFTNFDRATIDVVERPFDLWRNTNFTSGDLTNPAISGATADPDDDGASNLHEYLFSTPPKIANVATGLRAEIINGSLEINWTQITGSVDIQVEPERADQLEGPWFIGPGLFARSEMVHTGGTLIDVKLRSLLSMTATSRAYVRLRLTLAE